MRERPILFSAPMVRAILAGNKTQTRRAVKFPHNNPLGQWEPTTVGGPGVRFSDGTSAPSQAAIWHTRTGDALLCPYGQPGDRLWVRESFWGCDAPGWGDQPCVVYDDEWHGKEYRPAEVRPWARKFGRIPSIHMPRDCSRITLEITDVRMERLQAISYEDALAEGAFDPLMFVGDECHDAGDESADDLARRLQWPQRAFRELWEQINGSGAWEANPWVWVVEFESVAHPKQHDDGGADE